MVFEDMGILGSLAADMTVLQRQMKYVLAPCTFSPAYFMADLEVCVWVEILVQHRLENCLGTYVPSMYLKFNRRPQYKL